MKAVVKGRSVRENAGRRKARPRACPANAMRDGLPGGLLMDLNVEADEKVDALAATCAALLNDDNEAAVSLINERYPFVPVLRDSRGITTARALTVYVRDGFIDRYSSGKRLIFPGTLRLLSELMPLQFPFHPNWKMNACHLAYWEHSPVIDHVEPLARGGSNVDTNLVTTSAVMNARKANFTLEELG
jgi:hypothetical protein